MRLNEKGSILAWVLVATMVLMIMCASMARMMLFRMSLSHREADSIGGKQQDQAAVAMLTGAWTPAGRNAVCSTNIATTLGWTCAGGTALGGTCSCTCTPTAGACPAGATPGTSPPARIVVSAGASGACQVTVTSCP